MVGMFIERDISPLLANTLGSFIQVLSGPRQSGKSTLFAYLSGKKYTEITFDDLQMRRLAEQDPGLFLAQYSAPLLLDEVQYVPNLFPELKKIIDGIKRKRLSGESLDEQQVLYRLTGSDQVLMDKKIKETLVGRASYFYLNTLSVHEIKRAFPNMSIDEILFKGGWPELYINEKLSTNQYLNDYIRSFVEKDIVLNAGIKKQSEFHTILSMLAARSGCFINYSAIAQDSGVKSATVKEWCSILEREQLLYSLQPRESNLNKRLIKAPKIYFLDTGLATRLQGWTEKVPLMNSPQVGLLFETLVLSELIKLKNNYARDWRINVWRTKDGDEVDFVIENNKNEIIVLDAKLGIHAVSPKRLPASFTRLHKKIKELIIVSYGGKKQNLVSGCLQVPIAELTEYLLNF